MVLQDIIYLTLRYTLGRKDKVGLRTDDEVTLPTNVWSMGEGPQYTIRQVSVLVLTTRVLGRPGSGRLQASLLVTA